MGTGPDPRAPGALNPTPGQGPGWAKAAAAVAAQVPPAEIEAIHVFRPIKREGREWGTAVVTRRHPEGRLQVFTVKYMLIVRGKERGQAKVVVEEVGLSPEEVLRQVMQSTAERTGEVDPPVALGPGAWYES